MFWTTIFCINLFVCETHRVHCSALNFGNSGSTFLFIQVFWSPLKNFERSIWIHFGLILAGKKKIILRPLLHYRFLKQLYKRKECKLSWTKSHLWMDFIGLIKVLLQHSNFKQSGPFWLKCNGVSTADIQCQMNYTSLWAHVAMSFVQVLIEVNIQVCMLTSISWVRGSTGYFAPSPSWCCTKQ